MVQFKHYIGIATTAIGIFLSSCDSQTALSKAQCSLSSSDAFNFFKESVRRQDVGALNESCSEHFPYIDTLATVLAEPEIELIPEEKDGAFGIKKIGNAELYYTRIKAANKSLTIKAVMFQRIDSCYKIINIAGVDTTKQSH